ncbi:hypothetical protein [Halogeometricum borinquense]|uniref:hypothetical protein n=1 Tax=Halogeometricum borinquense TaxID=60847 RepID=UPI001EF7B2EF|nr:hypothetical protein [Halogeometricum borinquense]
MRSTGCTASGDTTRQARRFARWHVYREKGYDTIPTDENPDRIAAVLLAIIDLDDEEFEDRFKPLYKQVMSHDRPDVEPSLDLPDSVYHDGEPCYKQNIYLEESLEEMKSTVTEQLVESIDQEQITEVLQADNGNFFSKAASLFGGPNGNYGGLTIDGTSGIDTVHLVNGKEQTIKSDDPFERGPDARLELYPSNFDFEAFRFYVGYNLICQIRDCFIGMGVEPPAQYRVLGPGKDKYTGKYHAFDFYPEYHNPGATIPGYIRPAPI